MSQKIKTVIGNVLITVYSLSDNVFLICTEGIINLINIVRLIRATDNLQSLHVILGNAEKC